MMHGQPHIRLTHNFCIEFYLVTNYNVRFIKILHLILGVIFMLLTVSVTVIIIFPVPLLLLTRVIVDFYFTFVKHW